MIFKIKKKFGQHFLQKKDILEKIVNLTKIENKDIIEIGPGFGALTKEILRKKPNSLLIIEKDKSLKKFLSDFNLEKNTSIVFDDALKVNLEKVSKVEKVTLIANLPYNIATTLIINWIKYINFFETIVVMVQKEVADRLTAEKSDKSYSRLSVLVQLFCSIKKRFDVDPQNFNPPPKVISSVIQIIPKKNININYERIDQLLKHSFFSRRKKIKNNLIKIYPNIEELFLTNHLDINMRPQDISPKEFLKILNFLT